LALVPRTEDARCGHNADMFPASFLVLLFVVFGSGSVRAQSCPVTPESDALRQITQCLGGGDCRRRTVVNAPNLGPGCDNEIEVWSWHSGRASVAIRDRKMCLTRRKAQPDLRFVHGLLMPMASLCGVEDPQLRAAGSPHAALWRDAWEAARLKLAEEDITLVINPPTLRSQTHLHIHLMRGNGVPFPPESTRRVATLEEVWIAAEAFARERGIGGSNYGIAIRKAGSGFAMLVEAGLPVHLRNPEARYAVFED
jgi:hypothetical protein